MTSARLNLTLVGAFVLAGVLSLIAALAFLAGRSGPSDTYYTFYSNVTGLKYGSQVLFEGYPVGQVEKIEPVQREGRTLFRVKLSVTRGWRIPEDSVARSTASGVLAPQTIAISAGQSRRALAPGAVITPGGANDLVATMNQLAENADQLTERALLPLAENLNHQIAAMGEIIQKDLGPLIHRTHRVMAAVDEQLPGILENARLASTNLAAVSEKLDNFTSEDRMQQLDRIVNNADRATTDLQISSRRVEETTRQAVPEVLVTVRELRASVEALSRRSEAIAHNLESSTRNLQEFSRNIRQSPGALLRSPLPVEEDGPEGPREAP